MTAIDSSDEDRKSNSQFTAVTPGSAHLDGSRLHRKIQVNSNWTTFDEQPLSSESMAELFSNIIPAIRHPKLVSTEECARLVDIIKTTQVVCISTYSAMKTEDLAVKKSFEFFFDAQILARSQMELFQERCTCLNFRTNGRGERSRRPKAHQRWLSHLDVVASIVSVLMSLGHFALTLLDCHRIGNL